MAPLLTHKLSHNGPWQCIGCVTDYTKNSPSPWKDGEGFLYCDNCIRGRFELAMNSNHHWPAQWGDRELHIEDFANILFDAEFVHQYKLVYARHVAEEDARPRDAASLAEEVPDNWELGRQYQRCPVCSKGVQLKEACNHMLCPVPCGTNYCYICGKEVSTVELGSHWARGGCPRNNHPDDANAWHDGEEEVRGDDDDDADSDESTDADRDLDSELVFDMWGFIPYAWNLTMATANERTRRAMRNILSRHENVPLSNAMRGEIARVHIAMMTYKESHGVDAQRWNELVEEHDAGTQEFLERPGSDWYRSFRNGLLEDRAGGVFDMLTGAGRREAYNWVHSRIHRWEDGETEEGERKNFAMLHMGPGDEHTPDRDRRSVYRMMDTLVWAGTHEAGGGIVFEDVHTRGQIVSVEVTSLAALSSIDGDNDPRPSPLSTLDDWLIGPEFLIVDML
jgi:hypothetical protein